MVALDEDEEMVTQDGSILDTTEPYYDTMTEEYKRLLDSVNLTGMVKLSSPRQTHPHENSVDTVGIYVDQRNVPS